MADRFVSKVKWFHAKKGIGFLQPIAEGERDIFVHYSFIEPNKEGYKILLKNQKVEFDLVEMPNGDRQAHNIIVIE